MKLSVVFPSKNQSLKLFKNIKEQALPYFENLGVDFEFVICIDASNEENQEIAKKEMVGMPENVRLLDCLDHPGKGHNVQRGILESNGEYVLFMDADLATDLKVIEPMLPVLGDYECQIASRYAKGAVISIKQPFMRRFISKCSRILIKMTFGIKVKDTQCGYKLFRTDLAKEVAKRQIIDGFAFDLEYLYFMKLNGYRINEVPCVWTDDDDSTIKSPLKTSLRFFKEMGKIKRNKKNYKLTPEEIESFKEVN